MGGVKIFQEISKPGIKAQENTVLKDSNYGSKNESFPPSPSLLTQFNIISISYHTAIIKAKLIL